MFDATQVKLPYNFNVPYIGYNSVNDKMTSRTPYEPTMSWQFKTRREFGIPIPRKKQVSKIVKSIMSEYHLVDYRKYDYT